MESKEKRERVSVWVSVVKEVYEFRHLVRELARVRILAQFQRSFLGIAWLFISPLLGVLIWLFFSATELFKPGETSVPYACYALMGTTIWTYLFGMMELTNKAISEGAGMFTSARFPYEVLILERVIAHTVNFVITLGLNVIVLIGFGVQLKWTIIFFPLVLLPSVLLFLSFGMILSVVHVVALDAWTMFMRLSTLMFYVTPVVYSPEGKTDFLEKIVKYNPLTYLIMSAREMMIGNKLYQQGKFFWVALLCFAIFFFTVRFFYVSSRNLTERIPL
jgi:lipopolysaccharide transport system permease protein